MTRLPSTFLSYRALELRWGMDRSTIRRSVAAGLVPAPVRLSPNKVGFVRAEIEAHELRMPRASAKRRPSRGNRDDR